jgi:hypothetical protein
MAKIGRTFAVGRGVSAGLVMHDGLQIVAVIDLEGPGLLECRALKELAIVVFPSLLNSWFLRNVTAKRSIENKRKSITSCS